MEKKKRRRYLFTFIFLGIMLIMLVYVNIQSGSVDMTPGEVIDILLFHQGKDMNIRIVWDIRLPRILAAVILGGALSVSGFLLQTFFSNPIAGPFVLGISSGAKLAVSLLMIVFLSRGHMFGSILMILAAFIGAMASMGFILLLSRRVQKMSMLIVGGVMIGYICSAITDFLVTFADDSDIVNLRNWSMGSFSGMDWQNIVVMTIVTAFALFCCIFLAKPMSAYQLGETYAQNMGVNIRGFRIALILISSLLSACVTAFAGPISFVGIAVPHLVKKLLNTSRPHVVMPACFLGGSVFCLVCDMIARTAFAPTDLNISSVTALFGAPVVLWMMAHKSGKLQRG